MTINTLVNCQWNKWGPWNECSASCGSGRRVRERTKLTTESFGGRNCQGNSEEDVRCTLEDCPGSYINNAAITRNMIIPMLVKNTIFNNMFVTIVVDF